VVIDAVGLCLMLHGLADDAFGVRWKAWRLIRGFAEYLRFRLHASIFGYRVSSRQSLLAWKSNTLQAQAVQAFRQLFDKWASKLFVEKVVCKMMIGNIS